MSNSYRLIHLSDIHIGQEKNINIPFHEDIRNELLRDADKLAAQTGPVDALVITGDTTYSGQHSEYQTAGEWLGQLCGFVGCPEESVLVIPGNHDVDWTNVTPSVDDMHARVLENSPKQVDQHISTRFYQDHMASDMLLAKLNNYREFANRYGKDFESCEYPIWIYDVPNLGYPIIRFVGLNSALFSGKEDAKGSLILGSKQYILGQEDNVEYVILLHHPIEWLKDGPIARDYLATRARVWMIGHEHQLRLEKNVNVSDNERLEIYAGATNPPDGDGYEYRYNWLEFSNRDINGKPHLVISIWPRIWTRSSTEFTADRNLLQGQENKDISLLLPEPKGVRSTYKPETLGHVPLTHDRAESVVEKGTMSEPESKQRDPDVEWGFKRVQFLFWKKLDRTERVHVLVEAGILPDFDYLLTPVWLRRGLEAARQQRKLVELWDRIMDRIPAEEREDNPFA